MLWREPPIVLRPYGASVRRKSQNTLKHYANQPGTDVIARHSMCTRSEISTFGLQSGWITRYKAIGYILSSVHSLPCCTSFGLEPRSARCVIPTQVVFVGTISRIMLRNPAATKIINYNFCLNSLQPPRLFPLHSHGVQIPQMSLAALRSAECGNLNFSIEDVIVILFFWSRVAHVLPIESDWNSNIRWCNNNCCWWCDMSYYQHRLYVFQPTCSRF